MAPQIKPRIKQQPFHSQERHQEPKRNGQEWNGCVVTASNNTIRKKQLTTRYKIS